MNDKEIRLCIVIAILLTAVMLSVVACQVLADRQLTERQYIAGTNVLEMPTIH